MASYSEIQDILRTQALSVSYKFGVRFVNGALATSGSLAGLKGDGRPGLPTDLDTTKITASPMLLVQTATLPKRSNEPISFFLSGMQFKHPGRSVPTQEIVLTFIETADMPLHKIKRVLREYIWSPSSGDKSKENNSDTTKKGGKFFTTFLNKLDQNVADASTNLATSTVWIYRLNNCFLQDEETPNFDGNSNDPEIITLTIGFENYDEGIPTAPSELGFATAL